MATPRPEPTPDAVADTGPREAISGVDLPTDLGPCQAGQVRCLGTTTVLQCQGGGWVAVEDCSGRGLACGDGACVTKGGGSGGGCAAGPIAAPGGMLLTLLGLAVARFRRR